MKKDKRSGRSGHGDLPREEFLAAGERAVRWAASYLEENRELPVMAVRREGELLEALPSAMPEEGEPLERIEEDFRRLVLPAVTHWNHPRFFAYFAISGSAPGVLGELYAAALNTNGMKWITCPASAELEKGTLRWLRRGLGLPGDFEGILADAASTSTLLALVAARERATGYRSRSAGIGPDEAGRLRLYASEEAHSSVEKAAILIGAGLEGVRRIPSDRNYRMDAGAFRRAVREDREAGRIPFAVVATAGTTTVNAVDPLGEIAGIAREESLWMHVDAAYGGAAAFLPEKRDLFRGWEEADTVVVNPHKWLFTPIDASAFFFRDGEALRHAFSLVPEYLRTRDDADEPMDYGFQLGRRFRSLKLWFVLRSFGRRGIEERIRRHIEMARAFADRIDADPEWERLAPAPFSTVCFRHRPPGEADEERLAERNAAILDRVNRSGEAYLSHAVLKGRYALRMAIGHIRTGPEDLEAAWNRLRTEAARAGGGRRSGEGEKA